MNIPASYLDPQHMHSWEMYSTELDIELRQCLDEGRDVAAYADVVKAVQALPPGALREELADALWPALTKAPLKPDYPYDEPDDLSGIRALRPPRRALPSGRSC